MESGSKNGEFTANENFISAMVEFGYDRETCVKALFATQNQSVEAALEWLLENESEEDEEDSEAEDEPHKMVLVFNTSLGMGVGKVAAQAGHATLGIYRELISTAKHHESLALWEQYGEKKIALRAENEEKLISLQAAATELGLPSYLVEDAGFTQIPSGSKTVLSIFGSEESVNKVTGKLKLL
ncbi:probable peptidyl-tRNA hydrolase 2 isoform X2 [Artemia franciscana]